jgi:competence protein ComEC
MLIQKAFQLKPQVLWWSGDRLAPEVLKHLKPQVAIASANRVDVTTARELAERGIVLYLTGENGAVQWTPNQGFRTSLSTSDVDATAFYN